jgi:hypothetical protein
MKKQTWATSAIIAYNFHPPRGVYLEERLLSHTCLTVTSLYIIHCTWARYCHLFVYTTYKNIYIHFEKQKHIYTDIAILPWAPSLGFILKSLALLAP